MKELEELITINDRVMLLAKKNLDFYFMDCKLLESHITFTQIPFDILNSCLMENFSISHNNKILLVSYKNYSLALLAFSPPTDIGESNCKIICYSNCKVLEKSCITIH